MTVLRVRRIALAAGLGCAALIVGGLLAFKPFETSIAVRKAVLRLGGVRRVRAATLAAYELDRCRPGRPCRCVALIHGLGDSALTWDSIMLGSSGASPVPEDVRVLALEFPGSEGSLPPPSPAGYSVPAMAGALRPALEERCPRWTLAGNSLGGWVAASLALQWPSGVERLVLVNAAGLADPTGQAVETARVLQAPDPEKLKAFTARAYHRHMAVPERAWPAVVASINARPTAAIVGALSEKDLLDRSASRIAAPTVVLWGASDRALPRSIGEGFARKIPGATLELLPECGHLPQRECPGYVSRALFGK